MLLTDDDRTSESECLAYTDHFIPAGPVCPWQTHVGIARVPMMQTD